MTGCGLSWNVGRFFAGRTNSTNAAAVASNATALKVAEASPATQSGRRMQSAKIV